MISKLILSVVVATVVTLACILLGAILLSLSIPIAITVGQWLKTYAAALGILGGLWYFFAGTWGRPA